MRTIMASIETYGLRHERLGAADAAERYPQVRVLPGDAAVLDLDAGYLRPELALVSATACAERAGAEVCRHTTVTAVEPDADGVTVRTSGGARRFRSAVVAAGAWTGPLLPGLGPVVTVRRPLQAWFVARHPEWFAPGDAPVLTRAGDPQFYVLPSVDGAGVKVGLSTDGHELVPDPDALDRTVSLADVARFQEVVTGFLPDLVPDPIRLGAYQEGYTADQHALVGPVPGTPHVVLLAGFSGHGFKLSPIIGDIAADLALEGSTERSIPHLDPARYLDGWPG
jgi:sarcosine oxidase